MSLVSLYSRKRKKVLYFFLWLSVLLLFFLGQGNSAYSVFTCGAGNCLCSKPREEGDCAGPEYGWCRLRCKSCDPPIYIQWGRTFYNGNCPRGYGTWSHWYRCEVSSCSGGGDGPPPPPPPTISEFRITNFVKRKDPEGKKFYIILAEQMKVGFKANIAWTVAHASSCTASCVYKDRQGSPISEDCEWSGKVSASGGKRKVQPKTPGVVEYKLKCSGAGGSASASFSAGIKEVKWKEVHPASFLEPLVLPVAQTFSDSLLAAVKLIPKEDKR